jgi:Homing endonuclease associated repeat
MGNPRASKSQIIFDIRRVARLLCHSPSSVEYRRAGKYDVRTVQRKFNTSWSEIIHSAGLRYTPRTSGKIASTAELRRDLLRVAAELDHPPTRSEYQKHGKFDSQIIKRRSGKKTWEDAVAALAGFSREAVKQQQQKGGCYRTTQEWLSRLRQLSEKLGHAPTTREANKGGINAYQLCQRVGGEWEDVLKAAKIDLRTRSQQAKALSTPTKVIVEDVFIVSRRLGRPPLLQEYVAHGHYSGILVRGRLGGWCNMKRIAAKMLDSAHLNGSRLKPIMN